MNKVAVCFSIVFLSLSASGSTGDLQCMASSINLLSGQRVDVDLIRITKDYYQESTDLHHFTVVALSHTKGDGWGIRIEDRDTNSVLSKTEAYFSTSDMGKPINLFGRNVNGTASIDCFKQPSF